MVKKKKVFCYLKFLFLLSLLVEEKASNRVKEKHVKLVEVMEYFSGQYESTVVEI